MTLFTLWLQMCIIKVQGCTAYPWPRFVVKINSIKTDHFENWTTLVKWSHFWKQPLQNKAIFKITVIKLCHFWKLNNRYKKGSFLKNKKIRFWLSKMFRFVWFWLVFKIKFLHLWGISWVFEIYVTLDRYNVNNTYVVKNSM